MSLYNHKVKRLRNIAGSAGNAFKRSLRMAFYLATQVSARLPVYDVVNRALARWLPPLWVWLRNRKLRYREMAEGPSVGVSQNVAVITLSEPARYQRWIVENEKVRANYVKRLPLSNEEDISVAILIEARPGQVEALMKTIKSLVNQSSSAWQCIIAIPAGSEFNEVSSVDSRITTRAVPSIQSGSILVGLAEYARTPFLAILGVGDRLSPVAIEEVMNKLRRNDLDVVYCDEDLVTADGIRHTPSFKPGWSPELLYSYNYFGRLTVARKSIVERVGGFDAGLSHAQEWDLNLRISAASGRIDRITKVLCHRAAEGPSDRPGPEDPASASNREAIRRFWAGQGKEATIETLANGTQRAIWPLIDPPLVSVIIPNKNKPELLRVCVNGLLRLTSYSRIELIIVDNDSSDLETLEIYDKLRDSGTGRIIPFLESFNYSAACNTGARAASGDLLLFLNNDIEVTDPAWLSEMVRCAMQPGVGIVGTKLVYPNGGLQHAGVIVGMHLCGLIFRGVEPNIWGVFGSPDTPRNYLAIMGACQMVNRTLFERLEGFDESYRISNSDVALCLRAWKQGYRTVYTPFAQLTHHEGASRGHVNSEEDLALTAADIRALNLEDDPFFHPGLSSSLGIPALRIGADPASGIQVRQDIARLLGPYPGATKLDLFDDADVEEAVFPNNGQVLIGTTNSDIKDYWSAANYCISKLRHDPALRARFPRALSDGAEGGFASWICGQSAANISEACAAELSAVFSSPPGNLVRQLYLTSYDLQKAFPLGLMPGGRREFFAWLFQQGVAEHGLRSEAIWWFVLECAEDPGRELVQTYLMNPNWQRLFPEALTDFGSRKFRRWLTAMYGQETEARPSVLSPAEQIRVAWQSRLAWQRRFPEALNKIEESTALIQWLGTSDSGVSEDLRCWCLSLDILETTRSLSTPGVNVVGHFAYPSGLRTSVEGISKGLRSAGVNLSLRDVPVDWRKDDPIHSKFMGLEQYATTLVHVQPEPFLPRAFERSGLYPRSPKSYRIGYWYWEMDRIPANWVSSAVSMDELWAATTFVCEALKDRFKLPVVRLPPGVELAAFKPRGREHFGIPRNKFAFVFAFNMMSIMERKNPLGLIRAFERAFTRHEPVVLILKTHFGGSHRTQISKLRRAAAQAGGEIVVIDENYSQDMMLSLIQACDAYISLHRSEGLGLTMAEAMLLGKPTIATRFSGNVDFMNDKNSLLVDYRLVPLGRSYPPYEADMTWAEPSEEHAARLMRQLFDDRSFARKLGASGMVDLQRNLSVATAGRRMRERLEAIIEEQKLLLRRGA